MPFNKVGTKKINKKVSKESALHIFKITKTKKK